MICSFVIVIVACEFNCHNITYYAISTGGRISNKHYGTVSRKASVNQSLNKYMQLVLDGPGLTSG